MNTLGVQMGYITYYLACYVKLQVPKHGILYEVVPAKHAWVSLEKISMGQMGRLEEKIAALLLYSLHSFPLDCLIFFWTGVTHVPYRLSAAGFVVEKRRKSFAWTL